VEKLVENRGPRARYRASTLMFRAVCTIMVRATLPIATL